MDNKLIKQQTTSEVLWVDLQKKVEAVISIKDCFSLPTIAILKKNNEAALKDAVKVQITELNLFFSDNSRMDKSQVEVTVNYILRHYYGLTLGDLKLIFEIIIKSKVFGSLSPNIIIQEIEKYFSDRLEIAESVSLQKHYEVKSNNTFDDKLMKLWYAKVKENGIPPSRKEEIEKEELEFQKFKAEYERNKINNASSV